MSFSSFLQKAFSLVPSNATGDARSNSSLNSHSTAVYKDPFLKDYTGEGVHLYKPIVVNKAASAKTTASTSPTVVYNSGSSNSLAQGDYDRLLGMISSANNSINEYNSAAAAANRNWQAAQNKIAMDFNASEAQKNRDWQEMMCNTAHQREVADLKAAGLNPVLSASGGNGAAVTSGATASGVSSAGGYSSADTGYQMALLNFLNNVMGYATSTAAAGISAGAVVASAKTAADASTQNTEYSSNAKNPFAGLINAIYKGIGHYNSRYRD